MQTLKDLIKDKYGTISEYSKLLNISRVSLSYKINNQVPFTIKEVKQIKNDLKLTNKQVVDFFIDK